MNFPVPIYLFHHHRRPVVDYQGIMPIHYRWTGKVGEGLTYGEALRSARLESKSAPGLVCLEHDLAVPREAWEHLASLIHSDPADVAVVNYRLYPASTGMDQAVWAHRIRRGDGTLKFIAGDLEPPFWPAVFGLGCTYLPGRILDVMPEDLRQWDYPRLDSQLSELALELECRIRCVQGLAVHMHY